MIPSVTVFVAKVVFSSIAVVLAVVFLAILAPGARTSLVMAVTTAVVFGFLVILALRPRSRARRSTLQRSYSPRGAALRRQGDHPVPLDDRHSPLDDGATVTHGKTPGSVTARSDIRIRVAVGIGLSS